MSSRSHSFRAVQLIIGGVPISGFFDGGGPTVEYDVDVTETTIGLDGEAVSAFMNNDSASISFTLQQQSASNAAILGIWNAQTEAVALGIERPPMPVALIDTLNGDSILDSNGVIEQLPGPSKQREAGGNTWRVRLPRGRRSLVLAANRVT